MIANILKGRRVTLRPVRAADLDGLYDAHTAIRTRGSLLRADPRPWHAASGAGE